MAQEIWGNRLEFKRVLGENNGMKILRKKTIVDAIENQFIFE